MRFHVVFGSLVILVACLHVPAAAEDCGPLKLISDVQMMTTTGSYREMVPVTINGASKLLLLDTGGYMTQVSEDTAKELQMAMHDSAVHLYDVSGNESRHYVIADTFRLGTLLAQHQPMMVSPAGLGDLDGIISTDLMLRYDIDIDFGAGRLRYFSPDHCAGKVVYWSPSAVAAVPITVRDRSRVMIPVKLDGKDFNAMIDTGATRSTISLETAKRLFDLDPQSPGMQKAGNVNGDSKLASFTYVFHTLSFNGIDVSNPRLLIMPDRMGSSGREQQTGNRALLDTASLTLPELVLGMDILRHLHIYMAFNEKYFYVSAGSDPRKPGDALSSLDQAVALSPTNPGLLNTRCFVRGMQKVHLDEALQDCDQALKARPNSPHILDSKAFVLYQLGRYQDALDTYNAALAIEPDLAASLYVRGHAKLKLGDASGGDADIAAAKALDGDIQTIFRDADLTPN
jgi:predicted aspartyl protease